MIIIKYNGGYTTNLVSARAEELENGAALIHTYSGKTRELRLNAVNINVAIETANKLAELAVEVEQSKIKGNKIMYDVFVEADGRIGSIMITEK